jgi:hypothetical protein
MTIESMNSVQFDLNDAIAVLEHTPASLRALLEGLPDVWVRSTEGEGTWSPFDVIGHLIHAERTNWLVRVRHILSGDTRPFPPFDRTAMFMDSEGKSLAEMLSTFAQLRPESIAALRALKLTREDLQRTGQHPEFGSVTLAQLLATWVVHDLDHVTQVARTMAKAYTNATGPWSAYLSVLKDRRR